MAGPLEFWWCALLAERLLLAGVCFWLGEVSEFWRYSVAEMSRVAVASSGEAARCPGLDVYPDWIFVRARPKEVSPALCPGF